MVLESGLVKEREGHYALTGPLPPLAIPATLHDSLMARLDRLSAGKRMAQLGAVIGRQFAYALLRAVAPWDEETLQQALGQLVDAELLYPRGYPPEATYLFKHALIQEAAYQSLLTRTRQQYHQRIAQALAAHFPETAETQPELLAHHYTEAGLSEHAMPWWQRAGQRAYRALGLCGSAHASHQGAGAAARRAGHACTPPARAGPPDALRGAWGSRRARGTRRWNPSYTRAMALCQQVGKSAQLFAVLRARGQSANVRSEHQAARTVAEQLLDRGPAATRPRPAPGGPPCAGDHLR